MPAGSSSSSSNAHHVRNKEALERAKALVRTSSSSHVNTKNTAVKVATTGSGFVIMSGNSKKRRRAPKKLSPEEAAAEKARAMEREKEQRRQAAYQRLLARQELQAKKKAEAQTRKQHSHKETAMNVSSAQLQDTHDTSANADGRPTIDSAGAVKRDGDTDSESESDASDVSNLSEGDEADEKTILAMPVAVASTPRENVNDESEEEDAVGGGDDLSQPSEDDGREHGDLLKGVINNTDDIHNSEETGELAHEDHCENASHTSSATDTTHTTAPESDTSAETLVKDLHLDTPVDPIFEEERERTAITLGLQEFVAARTAAKLQELQAQKRENEANTARQALDLDVPGANQRMEAPDRPPSSGSRYHNDETLTNGDCMTSSVVLVENNVPTVEPDHPEQTRGSEDNKPRALWLTPPPDTAHPDSAPCQQKSSRSPDPSKQSSEASNGVKSRTEPRNELSGVISIPPLVTKTISDYRGYFANFHCILTSAYEQRLLAGVQSNSRESLVAAPANPHSDNSLRLQLKLYQSWQSIMQDYATVFGNQIATPRCMLPSASPFTAHYRINSTTRREVCEIVTTALDKLGDWEEHPSGLGLKTTWNLLWTWSKPRVERKTLLAWQKVNHFQHAKALTRKDCLKKNVGKYLAMGGRMRQAYECFVPKTFILPQEYVMFVQAYQARSASLGADAASKNIWIMKPVALSRGRGISLVNDLSQVVYGEQVVIQEYIANPLLVDGYKFDLRLYVLVTSFNPLEAFFYEDGFMRVCTRLYQDGDLSDLFVHLTNSSIQKDNAEAISASANPINEAGGSETSGTKMTLEFLWKRLAAMGADVERVRRDIDEVILKSLMCGEDHIPFQVNSFDLLGYDILLDEHFRPWLIEINSSPSMARENALDYQVRPLLDMLRLSECLCGCNVASGMIRSRTHSSWMSSGSSTRCTSTARLSPRCSPGDWTTSRARRSGRTPTCDTHARQRSWRRASSTRI